MPMLYTRNKPRKRKPNWKNILLTALCVVLIAASVTLLVKSIPAWVDHSGKDTMLENSATPTTPPTQAPTSTAKPTQAPTPTPEPTQEPTPTPVPPRGSGVQSVTFGAVGDIALHAHELSAAKAGNTYDFSNFFARVQPYVSWQDFTLGNLEAVVVESKYDETRAPVQLVQGLKEAGFDVLALANEHSMDADLQGAQASAAAIKNEGVSGVGVYTAASEYVAPFILTKDDLRIAVLNYTEKTDKTPEGASDVVKYLDQTTFDNDMQNITADAIGIDFVVVMVHWGEENSAALTDSQKAWAKTFADAGVDVVLGSGAHLPQKVEKITGAAGNETLVAYGLGNFLSGSRKDGKDAGAILSFTLTKDFTDGKKIIADVTYTPTWVLKYSAQGKYSFEIMSAIEYSNKRYANMAASDKTRVAQIADEITLAFGNEAAALDKSVRKMVDGVSQVVTGE